MQSKKITALFVAVFLTAALPVWAASRMPHFSLLDVVTGEQVASETFEGKTLLVTFFATWCAPCRQESASLKILQDRYGNDGFSVVAISVDETGAASVKKFVESMGINYPVILADQKVVWDFGGVYGIPTSFLVNSEGKVVKKYSSYRSLKVLDRDIRQIL